LKTAAWKTDEELAQGLFADDAFNRESFRLTGWTNARYLGSGIAPTQVGALAAVLKRPGWFEGLAVHFRPNYPLSQSMMRGFPLPVFLIMTFPAAFRTPVFGKDLLIVRSREAQRRIRQRVNVLAAEKQNSTNKQQHQEQPQEFRIHTPGFANVWLLAGLSHEREF
jgi:hypothetical protein